MTAPRRDDHLLGRRRRLRLAGSALSVAGLLMAACGGDDGGAEADVSSTVGGGTSGATTAPQDEPGDAIIVSPKGESYADGEPRQGGRMVFGLEAGFQTLSPSASGSNPQSQMQTAIFGNLMSMNDEGEVVPGNMVESMEGSADSRTWTMVLPETTFHDGTPFDGQAVVDHLEWLLDPATTYPYVNVLEPIESMVADGQTVTFTLKRPFPAFAFTFTAQGHSYVASPTARQQLGDRFGTSPVGAGPFKVKTFVPDQRVVLERNPDYHHEGLPYLDEIEFLPMIDSSTRLPALQTGDVDAAFTTSDQDWERAEGEGIKVLQQRSITYMTTMIHNEHAPLDDVRVRRALNMAVDNDALNEVVYGGRRVVMTGPLPEGHPFHAPVEGWPTYDLEGARELIEEYKAEKGLDRVHFRLDVFTPPEFQQTWTLIQQMWEQIGVTVTRATLGQTEGVASVNGGNYDASARYGSIALVPDVSAYNQFHSEGGQNGARYSDPQVDAALEALRASTDPAERKRQMAIFQQRLADTAPFTWHLLQSAGFYIGPKVKGFPGAHPVSTGYVQAELIWV